jgi:hypothetical protein
MTRRERKVETTAAVLAAYIGEAFSSSENTMIGVATDIDENRLVQTPQLKAKSGKDAEETKNPNAPKPADLVPWIRLDQKSKPAETDSVR